jgi:hypothetical protein
MYTPDRWLLIKINGKDPHYRVFASWYGGYLGSDSWRMNSGVTKVSEDDEFYRFHGSSGSVYGSSVLNSYIEKYPDLDIQIVPEDVTITELEFK